ncbi:MAG TPA: AAA family ATPase [Candidatus Dormibacteraeota bacterium]|nr:AAA family ATPase [Candidatus Dormibacteraeota bacterium]
MKRTESYIKETEDLDVKVLDNLYNAAKSILNASEKKNLSTVLFTSFNDAEGTLISASHIAYLLTQLSKKVLLINLDLNHPENLSKYLEMDENITMIDVIGKSSYLSEAIQQTQYDKLDVIHLGEIDEANFLEVLNTKDIKSRLSPLNNYYDMVFLIGPEATKFGQYANIFELTESAVTVSKDKTSNYKGLKHHIDKLGLFNIVSFGIIRNSK